MIVTTSKQARFISVYFSKVYCLTPSLFLLTYAALISNDIINGEPYYWYFILYVILTNVIEHVLKKVSRAYISYDNYKKYSAHKPNSNLRELTNFYRGMTNDKVKLKIKIDDMIVVTFKKSPSVCLTSEEYQCLK